MKTTLRSVYILLFLLGLFFIPFNSFEGLKGMGEFTSESASYFLMFGVLVLGVEIFYLNKCSIPYSSFLFRILVVFLAWCFLTTLLNLPTVTQNYFKKTTGVNRFFRQYFVLIMSCFAFFLLYWNVIVKMNTVQILNVIRKTFLYSFIIVTIYGLLEIMYLFFNFYPAYFVLQLFDYFPFTEYDQSGTRISSVTFEAPALGTYLITVAGWMFSYIKTHRGYLKYVPTTFVLILTYYSGSRTALVVVLLQFIIFMSIVLNSRQKVKVVFGVLVVVFLSSTMIILSDGNKIIKDIEKKVESLDFRGNMKTNLSNKSRFGIQYANLVVFTKNLGIGVGYGQQSFEAVKYYPYWAKKDNYEFKEMYLNKNDPMFPPGYNLYVRLLAETGIIGFSIFIYFLYITLVTTRRNIKIQTDENKLLGMIVLVTLVGFMFNWLQTDTFRVYGFWINLAILIKISSSSSKKIIVN